MTHFFVACNLSGLESSAVIPAGKFELLSYTAKDMGIDGVLLESRLSLKEADEYRIIPCFSSVYAGCHGYQAQACQLAPDGSATEPIAIAAIGEFPESEKNNSNAGTGSIVPDIDYWIVKNVGTLLIRLRILTDNVEELFSHPWLFSVFADKRGREKKNNDKHSSVTPLPVPQKSQMVVLGEMRDHICSPTSVSMVIDYYHGVSSIEDVSRLVYNRQCDRYGLWPAGVWGASRYGLLGYVYRFAQWQEVVWLLSKRIPVIASIQYDEGELACAPMRKTAGHLVVIKGIEENSVIVNDPAAPDEKSVEREYDLNQFSKHWFDKKGIGYVLFCPGHEE
jgi:hypothetical protein